jgi:hypothetical protein
MEWLDSEYRNMAYARENKVCVLQPKWGRCAHPSCRRIWKMTKDEASELEKKAIFGDDLFENEGKEE